MIVAQKRVELPLLRGRMPRSRDRERGIPLRSLDKRRVPSPRHMRHLGSMTLRAARYFAGSLDEPGRFPGPSYSLHPWRCQVGGQLRTVPNSVCESCDQSAIEPSTRKLEDRDVRQHAISLDEWVPAMIRLIQEYIEKRDAPEPLWFVWHPAGDLQGTDHLDKIVELARHLGAVNFLLETQERAIVAAHLTEHGPFPENLTVRLSATMVDQPIDLTCWPELADLPTSRVVQPAMPIRPGERQCPSAGFCGDCRACWDDSVAVVHTLRAGVSP